MSFPAYAKRKPTGVEWLKELPTHWDAIPLRRLMVERIANGLFKKKDEFGQGTLLLNVFDVYRQDFRVNYKQLDRVACTDEELETYEVRANDLFFVRSSLKQEGVAVVCIAGECEEPVVYECHLVRVRLNHELLDGRFASYMLNSAVFRAKLISTAKITTMTTIDQEAILSTRVSVPPVTEQKAIAAFLDQEISKIDGLVAEQRRLIAFLTEKRQAVISHAVTKGLNPDAPMKPSGIPWLGDVPEHWEVKPLKYLAEFRSGGTPSKTVTAYWHGNVPWASSKDLKAETLSDTVDHLTQRALDEDTATLVPAGSVLVVVRGMILLHTFPVVQTLVPMAINQDLKALTPTRHIHTSYLPWMLRGSKAATFGRIDEAAHGTKVLRMEAWTSIELPVPPIAEQLQIADAVSERLTHIDSLRANAERAINLLQERRTALISAAVTGKIDVRQQALRETA